MSEKMIREQFEAAGIDAILTDVGDRIHVEIVGDGESLEGLVPKDDQIREPFVDAMIKAWSEKYPPLEVADE